jgi:hypothetical protein
MDNRSGLILAVGAALCLWCALYAWALEHTPYEPKDIWKTVVIGNGWILIALGILALLGAVEAEVYWLAVGYNGAAGLPVITWQLIQHAREAGRRETTIQPRPGVETEEEDAYATHAWRG